MAPPDPLLYISERIPVLNKIVNLGGMVFGVNFQMLQSANQTLFCAIGKPEF